MMNLISDTFIFLWQRAEWFRLFITKPWYISYHMCQLYKRKFSGEAKCFVLFAPKYFMLKFSSILLLIGFSRTPESSNSENTISYLEFLWILFMSHTEHSRLLSIYLRTIARSGIKKPLLIFLWQFILCILF